MKKFIILIGLAAAACGGEVQSTPEPIVVPQQVAVAVDSPCVPDSLGPKPTYSDTTPALRAAADAAERLQLLYAGRAQRQSRLNEIEPIIAACPRGTAAKK